MKGHIVKKIIAVFLFSLCFSCVSRYIMTENGVPIRQCLIPTLYGISYTVPEKYRSIVDSGMKYWNTTINKKFFVNIGTVNYSPIDTETNGFIVIGLLGDNSPLKNSACGASSIYFNQSTSCIGVAKIYINEKCLNLSPGMIETIVRHEAGHILGLGHSNIFTDIMWTKLEPTMQHPVDASKEEIERIYKIYGEE
jgi:hypothetical protein